ncbi:RagB/SusD family nutrient uptake outer membrane protein [Sinomicrobium soli]|uniref:RagB/SusD family nutrient uptake outer membrane protein n=1 Tax=Sinomicrobium sp. N-1-3-6 TaxID=2219864 RepID=UPI0013752A58|nr:RagB/SusD family nutrient uptake outer membrane protein [Sinomicrobium sp. N-1-3-6]
MRRIIDKLIVCFGILTLSISCNELDLVPEDAASTGSWYQTEEHFRQSLNEGYRPVFFPRDGRDGGSEGGWDDDTMMRTSLSVIKSGTVSSEFTRGKDDWNNLYKGIIRMLTVVKEVQEQDGVLSEVQSGHYEGEAKFLLGVYWTYLITHFGDVPFYEDLITVDESFEIARTDKYEILEKIYEYFDFAAQHLPEDHSNLEYATKGAALAYKARAALYMGDFSTAAAAAALCIDLGTYSLHPDFGELFLSKTKASPEIIFQLPRGVEFQQTIPTREVRYKIPRNNGGYGSAVPSWDLLASFECIDGLPIDQSPLFDPRNPFKNRDPRLLATIVPIGSLEDGDGNSPDDGSRFMDLEYNPHPYATRIFNYASGKEQTNNDTKSNQNYCSFNGLVWKKGVDSDWDDLQADNNIITMRYADVLLMYAEAKIELNEIDASVLEAINEVRDRAYANSTFSNPVVTTTDQDRLRYIIRNERRAELADESLRYMDLIRWKIADKIMDGGAAYGLAAITANNNPDIVDNNSPLVKNVIESELWFWGMTPQLDENGSADFEPLRAAGLCQQLTSTSFPQRQYLWPIPADERRLNPNLTQNEGY